MLHNLILRICLSVVAIAMATQSIHAADWTQFRGPNGSGISPSANVSLA